VAYVPVVEPAAASGREDEIVRRLVERGESPFAEQFPDRGRENQLAASDFGLEWRVVTATGEFPVDMNEAASYRVSSSRRPRRSRGLLDLRRTDRGDYLMMICSLASAMAPALLNTDAVPVAIPGVKAGPPTMSKVTEWFLPSQIAISGLLVPNAMPLSSIAASISPGLGGRQE
jgi:hypothetical protein